MRQLAHQPRQLARPDLSAEAEQEPKGCNWQPARLDGYHFVMVFGCQQRPVQHRFGERGALWPLEPSPAQKLLADHRPATARPWPARGPAPAPASAHQPLCPYAGAAERAVPARRAPARGALPPAPAAGGTQPPAHGVLRVVDRARACSQAPPPVPATARPADSAPPGASVPVRTRDLPATAPPAATPATTSAVARCPRPGRATGTPATRPGQQTRPPGPPAAPGRGMDVTPCASTARPPIAPGGPSAGPRAREAPATAHPAAGHRAGAAPGSRGAACRAARCRYAAGQRRHAGAPPPGLRPVSLAAL